MKKNSKKRKYNWIQISLYFIIICIEEVIKFFKQKNNKMKLVTATWFAVNLYGIGILISQPFCMWSSAVLNTALWAYVVATVVSFGLCPKESINYLFDHIIFVSNDNKKEKQEKYNHGYKVIDIQDYINTYNSNTNDIDKETQEKIAK